MLTITPAHGTFGQSIDDLVPILIDVSTSIQETIDRTAALVEQTAGYIQQLPEQIQAGVEATAYSAGKGAARGFGWNIILPAAALTGVVLGGVLLFEAAKGGLITSPKRRWKPAMAR